MDCGLDYRPDKVDPSERKVCKFDLKREFGDACTKENNYGYDEGKPCILVKINKVSERAFGQYTTIVRQKSLTGRELANLGFRT